MPCASYLQTSRAENRGPAFGSRRPASTGARTTILLLIAAIPHLVIIVVLFLAAERVSMRPSICFVLVNRADFGSMLAVAMIHADAIECLKDEVHVALWSLDRIRLLLDFLDLLHFGV